MKSGVLRDELHQEIHLVRKDVAVHQDQVLSSGRHVRDVKQLHVRLLRGTAVLMLVAALTCRNNVHPNVQSTLGLWLDVVTSQVVGMEVLATVSANLAVTAE